jgi:hypothetical protein
MNQSHKNSLATLAAVAALALAPCAYAGSASLDCNLKYSLTGWSAVFQHAEGTGTVTCENGRSMPVKISIKGAGLTVGKYHIDNGQGTFTDVHTIDEVLGDYGGADAHVGAVKSGATQLLTKGTVSLALGGTGEGVDIGIGVDKLTLEPLKKAVANK